MTNRFNYEDLSIIDNLNEIYNNNLRSIQIFTNSINEWEDMIREAAGEDATDLMEKLLSMDKKIVSYPLIGYWLDIGKHDDLKKAQDDIKNILF